jgi:hypothetical protein
MWVLVLGLASMLAAEIGLGASGMRTWLPFALLLPALAAGMWWLGRIKITIAGDEFHVDDAHIPLRFIAEVIPLDTDDRRLLLGPGADPLAFVIQRPWIRGAVQIVLNDPGDPTPYWVISTHHPEKLAAALS